MDGNDVYERITQLAKKKGVSMDVIARELGVKDSQHLSHRIIKQNLTVDVLLMILRWLNANPTEFFTGIEHPKTTEERLRILETDFLRANQRIADVESRIDIIKPGLRKNSSSNE